jgi:hypothetical protein
VAELAVFEVLAMPTARQALMVSPLAMVSVPCPVCVLENGAMSIVWAFSAADEQLVVALSGVTPGSVKVISPSLAPGLVENFTITSGDSR